MTSARSKTAACAGKGLDERPWSTIEPHAAARKSAGGPRFPTPDVVPVEYHPSPAGCYEHGPTLRALWELYPGDFGDPADFPDAAPRPECLDAQGRYSEVRRDEWGVVWKHLIFGVAGHPLRRPLDDWAGIANFRAPAVPPTSGPAFDADRSRARRHMDTWFLKSGWISIFEVMHAVRRFEDVLMDIGSDTAQIHRLADIITEYQLGMIEYLLARGVDAVQFGDDFGTQAAMMISPRTWRRFFRPRYELLMAPLRRAGAKIFFHTCGCGRPVLDELAGMGVHVIWPQLNAYRPGELARFCRESRIAAELHPDRGELMTRGTPAAVRAEVDRLASEFRVEEGGSWFYVEIDAGFPYGNIQALFESIGMLRNSIRGFPTNGRELCTMDE